MTFTPEQNKALSAPLDPKHVASRSQAGRSLSYIEGWHTIAEANRIFGFDAWNRETIDLRLLGEPRSVDGKARVEYMARVRITVGDTVREGCGFGQGIDKDVGQAHESALKEAETDAMKRALMTFGNPFGLALYDKSQANVQEPAPATITGNQRTELMTLFDHLGVPVAEFLTIGKMKDLRELEATRFDKAKAWINQRALELRTANEKAAA
jgi:DNA repair and recombination protein RAD52